MPRASDYPYPPTPDDVPDGYTDFSPEYRSRQTWLLVWVYVVFLLYVAMLEASLMGVVLSVASLFSGFWCCLGVPIGVVCLGVFVYLLTGFFYRKDTEKRALLIEITDREHPKLFGFIRELCGEIGVSEPHRVHVFPEPNAMAVTPTTLVHLFTPPKRELAVGLGLINALNLSEFKAVLAHEFGHFAQHGSTTVYTARAATVVANLINGQGSIDRMADRWRKRGSLFGKLLYGMGWLIRSPLILVYKLYAKLDHDLDREREFHADRVAASLAGSNSATHLLLRARYAAETYMAAVGDLLKAADHKLYSSDLYYHQHAAGDILRKRKRDPEFGRPPKLTHPLDGRKVQVFDPETADDHPPDDYHPSDHEREEHMKSPFVAADDDERSAWILFDDPVELRERMTYKLYRTNDVIRKGTPLGDPREVQRFIDGEHHETTYDAMYEGAYDDRMLTPGDLDELDELIRKEPWEDARLATVFEKLYHGLKDRVEDRQDLMKELTAVRKEAGGAMSKKTKKIIRDLEKDLDEANDWFRTLDRRVYLVYVQMSYRIGDNAAYEELVNRYRFHMAVQGIYKTARYHFDEAEFHLLTFNVLEGMDVPPEVKDAFVGELMLVFRAARKALKEVLREARAINMPAMKNFEEGERLADFLLDQDLIREPGEYGVSGKWVNKLFRQVSQVRDKASRLHFKSLGQILTLQERVADRFLVLKGFKQPPPLPPAG